MPVRLATPADKPAIAALCANAFFEENLFGVTIHPNRHQYPDDVQIFFHEWLREDFNTPSARVIVSTTTEDSHERITGMATWQRQGDDEHANNIVETWVDPGEFPALERTENRAMDPSKSTILHDSEPFFKHFWDPTTNNVPRKENWYLHLCCVDPAYHKRGFGRELVAWGLERAKAEGVHASVMASEGVDVFYLRYGFDEKVGNCCEGEGNPLGKAGVKGGDVLFMWAKGKPESSS